MKKQTVNWNDADYLQSILDQSKSRADALRKVGYCDKSSISRRKLNKAIEDLSLDISSFTTRTDRWDILPEVIEDCHSLAEILEAVGLSDQGDNHKTAKRYIKEFKLDTSHFYTEKGYGQGKQLGSEPQYTYKQVFCKESQVTRSTVRRYIRRKSLIEYKCADCGNEGKWQGRSLCLELEHKNGVNNDHQLGNLEYLCPNCHSQTATYRRKKRK